MQNYIVEATVFRETKRYNIVGAVGSFLVGVELDGRGQCMIGASNVQDKKQFHEILEAMGGGIYYPRQEGRDEHVDAETDEGHGRLAGD